MVHKLSSSAYQKLLEENLAWLLKQPRTLERQHIIEIIKESHYWHYEHLTLLQSLVKDYANNITLPQLAKLQELIKKLEGPHGD